eukprot:11714319-Alexandrium_andersonii.AAC.1
MCGRRARTRDGPPAVALNIATANVLTLQAGSQARARAGDAAAVSQAATGRRSTLLKGAGEASLHLVGVQEGRWPSDT